MLLIKFVGRAAACAGAACTEIRAAPWAQEAVSLLISAVHSGAVVVVYKVVDVELAAEKYVVDQELVGGWIRRS